MVKTGRKAAPPVVAVLNLGVMSQPELGVELEDWGGGSLQLRRRA